VRFQLVDFQIDAVADALVALGEATARFQRNAKLSAISLSAPTGAGKTVIATSVIEQMLYGGEHTEPDSAFTVLWVTDDPSLNQQTKRKMLVASSQIKPGQLVVVDQSLVQEALDPGKVYFAHIQQLGKGATNYIRTGDKRRWSLWDTIANTINSRGSSFLLVIDEAHRGTGTKKNGGKTITAQLADGAGGALPAPIVFGISATPQRFVDSISKTGQRTLEPLTVDPDRVRASGLIKDKIRIRHPKETQPVDSTLLELAIKDLREYHTSWATYSAEQDEPPVDPVLVVQVKPKISENDLRSILDTVASAWGDLDGKAIGHAFQDHTALNLGVRTVRYVAPQDIQDDPLLRVVLFKEALTTGWDCPRAEVMVSLRAAADHTYIAQLIGRMVRTPLARRISTDEVLNTVALYLPYFNEAHVQQVVTAIQSAEGGVISDVETDSVTCTRNPAIPKAVWDLLATLPTYTRPARNHRNEVARLNALAVLLAGTGLRNDAPKAARGHIVDTLAREAKRMGSAIDAKVADLSMLDYETQTVNLVTGVVVKEHDQIEVNARNIEDLFRQAKRTLGDAAAKWYWDALCDGGMETNDAKVTVAALADNPTVAPALDAAAETLIDSWRNEHNPTINALPDAKRAAFYTVWETARNPQQINMILPVQITASGNGELHPKHLYANGKKLFPVRLTGWEAEVLAAELAKPTLVAWYRNPTGGKAALAVPYEQSGIKHTLYPDFLFFHQIDEEVVCDIVDPHRPDAADAGPKWRGLATYAAEHGHRFRNTLAVIKDGDTLVSLDLKNPAAVAKLTSANNETDIRATFASAGGPY